MSYTFKLARRTARLRLTVSSIFVLAALACSQDDAVGPVSTATPQTTTTDSTVTAADSISTEMPSDAQLVDEPIPYDQGAPDTPEPAAGTEAAAADFAMASTSGPSLSTASMMRTTGIPFGDTHLPLTQFGTTYSGALIAMWPSLTRKTLETARAKGMRIMIGLSGHRMFYTDRGRFNLAKWKAKVSQYRKFNFDSYVKDGTVIGHYLIDEPFCDACWGGQKITYAQIEAMARYSKSLWPSLPTGVRAVPSHLGTRRFTAVDFGWAQWEGPLHVPSYRMTPEKFRDRETAAARALGLGVVFALNYLDAGDGTSHVNGTFAKDPNPRDNRVCNSRYCWRYAMTASEVRRVGRVLAAAPYGCAVLSWKYDLAFLSRSGMRSAIAEVARVARNRSRTSCKR
jgi:hypothetical protein